VVSAFSDEVTQAAQALARGELIGLPTETVYGLAGDALNPKAAAAIFSAKGRPADHPLIVHLGDASQVTVFARAVPVAAEKLMTAFWPGPLTLILPRREGVADAAAGGHATVALRCPSHPVAQQLLQAAHRLGVQGVAAPSANLYGRVSPTTAAHVRQAFPSLRVLDGGACTVGIESTIVDCSQDIPMLLRPGMLTLAELSHVCSVPLSLPRASHTPAPAAPGNKASHYAPRARLRVMSVQEMVSRLPSLLKLALWTRQTIETPEGVIQLTMPSDAAACAHDLFARLHELDAWGVQEIWVETPPMGQQWDGVRDRLQRASA